jgi:hypothetical protein
MQIRTLILATILASSIGSIGTVAVHAEPNNEGIEMDCPLSGNWVANGGYVIAKDAQGRYHRVYCVDGEWVDGGVITSYLTTTGSSTRPVAAVGALAGK